MKGNEMNDLYEPLMLMAKNIGNVAEAIDGLTSSVRALGNADASTPMGAMEALGAVFETGFENLSTAISELHND